VVHQEVVTSAVTPDSNREGVLQQINEWAGRSVSWLTLLMVIVTFIVVVLRYTFDLGWIWLQESVTYMHAAVFMLGISWTLKHQGHVRVDIFYRKFSRRGQAMVDLFGTLLLLIPVALFILWSSWDYVFQSWSVFEGSREAGGLPLVFLLKTLMLLLPLLLLLQAVVMLLQSFAVVRGSDG
jgi:TRAP-type mannitol/chloroaromatic compound transport system permease small subunit